MKAKLTADDKAIILKALREYAYNRIKPYSEFDELETAEYADDLADEIENGFTAL